MTPDVTSVLDLVEGFDLGRASTQLRLQPCRGLHAGRWLVWTGRNRLSGPLGLDAALDLAAAQTYCDPDKVARLRAALLPSEAV